MKDIHEHKCPECEKKSLETYIDKYGDEWVVCKKCGFEAFYRPTTLN